MRTSRLGGVADRFGDYWCEHCGHNQLGNTKFTMPTKMRMVGRMMVGSHLVVGRVENRDGVEWRDGMEREMEALSYIEMRASRREPPPSAQM